MREIINERYKEIIPYLNIHSKKKYSSEKHDDWDDAYRISYKSITSLYNLARTQIHIYTQD